MADDIDEEAGFPDEDIQQQLEQAAPRRRHGGVSHTDRIRRRTRSLHNSKVTIEQLEQLQRVVVTTAVCLSHTEDASIF